MPYVYQVQDRCLSTNLTFQAILQASMTSQVRLLFTQNKKTTLLRGDSHAQVILNS